MTFENIKEYCEDEGCQFEHLEGIVYLAKNVINGHCCFIEDLEFYNTATLCNYFYELNINAPESVQDFIHVYYSFRNNIVDKIKNEN